VFFDAMLPGVSLMLGSPCEKDWGAAQARQRGADGAY